MIVGRKHCYNHNSLASKESYKLKNIGIKIYYGLSLFKNTSIKKPATSTNLISFIGICF